MNDTRSLFYSRRFALCSRLLVLVCFGTQVLNPLPETKNKGRRTAETVYKRGRL